MKRLLILILIVAGLSVSAANAKSVKSVPSPVTGKVVDGEGRPVAYATVIAMLDDVQAAGTTTDDDGHFVLSLNNGEYRFSFEYLGYKSVEKRVAVAGATELGTVVLEDDNIKIEGVEVTAQVIRREADRFVVDVANMPSAIGKDGVELLQTSPGVFINDDKVTINGRSGTKVYVNEREVKYTGDRLLTYLRSIKSDEIQKIEVVPISGADYDADSSGGIIKITLRHKRDDGIMGNVGFTTAVNDLMQRYSPWASFDYRTGKWTVSASGNYSYASNRFLLSEETLYTDDSHIIGRSEQRSPFDWYGAKAGAVYEIDDNQSVGAEVEYGKYAEDSNLETLSEFTSKVPPVMDSSIGYYNKSDGNETVSARFNYIAKLDTLGSIVKVLADYTHQQSASHNNYTTVKSTEFDGLVSSRDSLYRDNSGTNYNIVTLGVGYEKVFSPKFTFKTGGKYTLNMMKSFSVYDWLDNDTSEWITRPTYNYDVDYTENIGAVYAIGVAKLGRWGITAGLRGEYTNTSGRKNAVRQNYFSLFPNANVSFGLTKDQSYMLVGQYSRNIQRPSFWALNPARMQLSEYSYQTGNPDLVPQYSDNLSLSMVMKYKYTVTFTAAFTNNALGQTVMADSEASNMIYIQNDNLDRTESYGLSVNLPFQFTKWWSANFNAYAAYEGTRIRKGEPEEFHPMIFFNGSMTFTLPAQFYLTLRYMGMGDVYMSNIKLQGGHSMSASLKKRLFKDKLSLSVEAGNLIKYPKGQNITYTDKTFVRKFETKEGWSKTQFIFSVSYNFNAGKKFNKRTIESDADAGRLAK